jgi:hypothetical protein
MRLPLPQYSVRSTRSRGNVNLTESSETSPKPSTRVLETGNSKLETAFPHFFPIFSRNRFSCSSVQYPQSSRINTDVYGIVIVLFSTST